MFFPVNFMKFLRRFFLQKNSGQGFVLEKNENDADLCLPSILFSFESGRL